MAKCSRCGKSLKKVYYHGGNVYGPECIRLFIKMKYGQSVKVTKADEYDTQYDMFASTTPGLNRPITP